MTRILRCTLCLTIAACTNLMPVNMKPVAIQVAGKSSRFVGDTLILAVFNRSTTPSVSNEVRSAIAGTMRAAFPAAVVLESLVDTLSSPRRVFISASLVRYNPSFGGFRGSWTGHAGIDVFVYDHRVSPGIRFVDLIRRSSPPSSLFSMGGNKAMGDVSRAAFDSANKAMVAFLDSVDDPSTRETLRSTAGVSEAEYASYLAPTGNASLAGRGFVTDGGREQPAAGQPVTLDPATSSARRWYERFGMVCNTFDSSASPDDLFRRTRRTTVTDADGNFTFSGLPPGTYFVRTRVLWDAPEPTDGLHKITQQYAFVSSAVTVTEGEQRQIALSQTGNAYLRCPSPMRGLGGRPKAGFPY
jgi:hypothetical protein